MIAHAERPDLIPDSDLVLSLTGPYVAGLDTVANTLAATVYAVLRHPEVRQRVIAESDALFAGDDRRFDSHQVDSGCHGRNL